MVEITSNDILSTEQINKNTKVFAGPGAGKTHFLVENIKNMITNNDIILKSNARKLLCITYTNVAVDEIKRRLDRYIDYVDVYTIHGFIIDNIIRPFQDDLKAIMKSDFDIETSKDGIISSQIEGLGILHGIDREDIYTFVRRELSLPVDEPISYNKKQMGEIEVDCTSFVNSLKNDCPPIYQLSSPSKIKNEHKIFIKKYVWSMVKKLTHNEILYFGYRIIEQNPLALYYLRVKYPYIFVDEFQDTNPLQTLLIRKICNSSSKVLVVGDLAQSIYGFQGATPSDFSTFKINGDDAVYSINGNRRSSSNIVNFCNFIRQKDQTVIQTSTNEIVSNEKIHFLMGHSDNIIATIEAVVRDGGAILTRTWAAAFDYIIGIEQKQALLLKKIYNSYYNTPISIRDEIVELNNVLWVRAFKFIFNLWDSYRSGSVVDFIAALKLYGTVQYPNIGVESLLLFKSLLKNIFLNCDNSTTCNIINAYNEEMKKTQYSSLKSILSDNAYQIQLFDELDRADLKESVSSLTWETSYKLFKEVFTDKSKYMTVHQAKGLEWNKIVIGVMPTRSDNISLSQFYSSPDIMGENSDKEFARIYYVACSRAIEDLYIHIPDGCEQELIERSLNCFITKSGKKIEYEFIK